MKIDLRSDTVTIPTAGMLDAMMSATVGDDVFGDDPTVKALESKAASLFGKEAAIFCPSGTMSNQIAVRLHTTPGSEVICHSQCHIYKYEGGGVAVNSLSSTRLIDGNRGRIHAQDVRDNINGPDIHLPITRLVCLEDTTNRGGGAIYDFAEIERIKDVCTEHKLALHLDGARVFNALVETKKDYKEYAKPFDTLSVCLSKGLGAPVGSLLIGSSENTLRANRFRKLMGGGMRQAGYLAAAGLYALDHNIERLKDDHRRSKDIESILQSLSYVESILPVETNIVIFQVHKEFSVDDFLQKLKGEGILAIKFGPCAVRMVTHLGITDDMIQRLAETLPKFQ
jgi:threonine aldolase